MLSFYNLYTTKMKFDNIRLLVNDFDRSYSFYSETLGLKATWGKRGENYASFDVGSSSGLALFRAELMNVAISSQERPRAETLQDKIVIVIEVDDVDETYAKLKSKGVLFLNEPKDMQVWGIRVIHLRDPENNLIELFSGLKNV